MGGPFGVWTPIRLWTIFPIISTSGSDLFLTGTAYGPSAVFSNLSVSLTGGRGQYFARYDTNGNALMAAAFGSTTTTPWASVADGSGRLRER